MPPRVGLVGHPLDRSLSPLLHAELYRRAGIDAAYELWDIAPEEWPADFAQQLRMGWRGVNVTTPHKERAHAECDHYSEAALLTGAVNHILVRADGALLGSNFDVDGAYFTLQGIRAALGKPLARVHQVGYGPAGRAVTLALLRHWRAERLKGRLTIWLRTPREVSIPEGFTAEVTIETLPMRRVSGLLINATTERELHLPEGDYGYWDLNYPKPKLPDRYSIDGLPMLVWQGFFSAARWFPEQLDASRDVALAGEVLQVLRAHSPAGG